MKIRTFGSVRKGDYVIMQNDITHKFRRAIVTKKSRNKDNTVNLEVNGDIELNNMRRDSYACRIIDKGITIASEFVVLKEKE